MTPASSMESSIGRRAARRRLRERGALRLLVGLLLALVAVILCYVAGRAHFAGDGIALVGACAGGALLAAVLALVVVGTNSA